MPKKYNYFITERKFTITHSQNTSFFCISVDGMTLTLTLEEGLLKKEIPISVLQDVLMYFH